MQTTTTQLIQNLRDDIQEKFKSQRVIMSFGEYLQLASTNTYKQMRSSAAYLRDAFDYYGTTTVDTPSGPKRRFKLFDQGSERSGRIIGCEHVHEEIYRVLSNFVMQGKSNKLILLHGPNGSSKSSTIEAIAYGMQRYSESDEGAVYTFNWIFPTEKSANPTAAGEGGTIGFGSASARIDTSVFKESYASIDESKIACKIHSELHDSPLFLLPMPQRQKLLQEWLQSSGEKNQEIPPHILLPGLSKRNQLIFENLLSAYEGDLVRVFRHVQVERFFYSKQYRRGIGTVEPQMSIDAAERQLTMDKNISNLPVFLNNIRFTEVMGPLIESNRGILEFSDMLKRPLETFKYLLTTIERGTIALPSSTANLDVVFFGTTNEKHLDAFKTLPDFSSFRSRFELITVPYLLSSQLECKIYEDDLVSLSKTKKIAPHSIECLSLWAVMTRLKQPDPENFETRYRALLARLDPLNKVRLYNSANSALSSSFAIGDQNLLREIRGKIYDESMYIPIYEGRFGASPREIRGILHRAAFNAEHTTLTPIAVFEELRRLVRDRSVYEFLQFEPRGDYHNVEKFIEVIENFFADTFEREVKQSMTLVDVVQYSQLLSRYIEQVVAYLRKEKLFNHNTSSYEEPNASIMNEFEKMIGVQAANIDKHRNGLLARIGGYKLSNPSKAIQVEAVFEDLMLKIEEHYHSEQALALSENFKAMLALNTEEEVTLPASAVKLAKHTLQQLQDRFGYDPDSAIECLKFVATHKKIA